MPNALGYKTVKMKCGCVIGPLLSVTAENKEGREKFRGGGLRTGLRKVYEFPLRIFNVGTGLRSIGINKDRKRVLRV